MNAVIVEIREKFAVALSDNGCIDKIKNKNYAIGQVIDMKKHSNQKTNKIAIMAASAAAVVLMCGAGVYAYMTPYSYVSLDVNPSIEYTLNQFDRVLSANAVNEDGAEILENVNVTNDNIEDAIAKTVEEISENGYFDGEVEGGIVISTSADDSEKAAELAEQLQESVEEDTIKNGDEVQVEAISVGKDRVLRAKELGVTPGKLNLVEKLRDSSETPESINIEDWLKKPVKEIMKATKDNRKAQKEQENKIDPQNKKDDDQESKQIDEGTASSIASQPSNSESSVTAKTESNDSEKTEQKSQVKEQKKITTNNVNSKIENKQNEEAKVESEQNRNNSNKATEEKGTKSKGKANR